MIDFNSKEAHAFNAMLSPRVELKWAIDSAGKLLDIAGHVASLEDTEENRQDVAELVRILSSLLRFGEVAGLKVRRVERLEVTL